MKQIKLISSYTLYPGPQNFEFPSNRNSDFIPPTRSQKFYMPGATGFAWKAGQRNLH